MLTKIEAIIREEKLDAVRETLERLNYFGMTIARVSGRGRQGGIKVRWRVGEYNVELLPKLKLEIVVLTEDVERVTAAISGAARTGEIGDGKMFMVPVENAVRVRTGEEGVNAI